ncbi:MAG: hypothetical protein AB1733_24505 [Thermodesulfobacteriota bacterium]
MRHTRSLLLSCVVCVLLFAPLVAVGAAKCPPRIYSLAGAPEPDAPQDSVRMDSGEVTIRLSEEFYWVDAVFHFYNTGETTTQRVGIPTIDNNLQQKGYGRCPTPRGAIVDLLELELWVDGRRAALSEERDFLKRGASRSKGQDSPRYYVPERRWMAADVTFAGHAKTTIRCKYKARYIQSRLVRVGYGTARAWKGNIGKLAFIIDCADVGGTPNVRVDTGFPEDSRTRLRTENLIIVETRDFEPAAVSHLMLDASNYQPGFRLPSSREAPSDFGTNWQILWGQPAQMWSRVDCDPKLTDPFFEADEWSYPYWITEHPDGHFTSHRFGDKNPVEDPPRLKHTAKCFSNSFGVKHPVNFCEARLLDGHMIDLLLHKDTPAFRDSLLVRIRNGKFACQYWILDNVGAFKCTTTRQKLTLDKRSYRKGDVIKGRIDFECLYHLIDPKDIKLWREDPTTTVKVFGVFKTIVR